MPEKKTEIKTYKVDFTCEVCGSPVAVHRGENGEKYLSIDGMAKGRKFSTKHVCTNPLCKTVVWLDRIYPYIEQS